MYQGMTEGHMNFDLSKTDNVASDVDQLNERNVICKFCSSIIFWQGTALKKQHQVSSNLEILWDLQFSAI